MAQGRTVERVGSRGSSVVMVVALLVVAAAAGLGLAGLLHAAGSGAPTGQAARSPGASSTPTSRASTTPTPGTVTLQADRTTASPGERVNLTGKVDGAGAGVTLSVQRRQGQTWADFDAHAVTRSGGDFSTYVELGRPGDNVLRVATGDGKYSDPITIAIG
jgi:hypothetical protein